jgi:hypothetical protein
MLEKVIYASNCYYMLELFADFRKGDMNYGIITLLPKVMEATKIQQYRPIYLLNCIYKWFTKCLTIRLETVAGRLIHQSQTAFLKGINIMKSVLAVHKILHETKRWGRLELS